MTKEKKLNWEKFRNKIHRSWHDKLKPFIESEECWEIYQQLKKSETIIYPRSEDVWRAFYNVNYDELAFIFVGQSPYHTDKGGVPYADGMAFSCSYVDELSPSLSVLYDAIEDDTGIPKFSRNPDLTYLTMQNGLLLNTCLTIDKGDKDSFEKHNVLWQPFITYLFEKVLDTCTGVPIITFGQPAEQQIVPFLDEKSHLWKCVKHPAYYARRKEKMVHNNVFTWASEINRKNNGIPIYWDYNSWMEKGLPF